MEEDESKEIKSMREKLESMCPCYAEMDVLLGHEHNATPIASYYSQEKDSVNGDDDVDVFLDKENNGLESPLNLDPLLNNDDKLVPVENLQDDLRNQAITPNLNDKSGSRKRSLDMFAPTYAYLLESREKACEISDNACLQWDRERWNEEKVSNMEKQLFEEVKLQKQMEFDEKQHAKKHEFEKKWNWQCELNKNQFQIDLTIVALSSSRSIGELEGILTLINKKCICCVII
ncbi:hypothetical protein O181_031418 [Austropuccinia psidii MF-1]|uniref:Uncharacterized protein n=1 Tax=Austropuccinia psidii MF-1 TaxID=1389203 RepID=A0A9Q3CXF1_9BASI|nr:hypothetical protein [Austropuccinia psidii MF-1]